MPAAMFGGAHLRAVVATTFGLVIVGSVGGDEPRCCANSGPTGRPVAWFSPDGSTWQRAETSKPVSGRGELVSVDAGSAGLVATEQLGGYSAGMIRWVSTDGRLWSNLAVSYEPAGATRRLASDGSRIVWTDSPPSGPLSWFVSTDGTNWRRLEVSDPAGRLPGSDATTSPQLMSGRLLPDGVFVLGMDPVSGHALVVGRPVDRRALKAAGVS